MLETVLSHFKGFTINVGWIWICIKVGFYIPKKFFSWRRTDIKYFVTSMSKLVSLVFAFSLTWLAVKACIVTENIKLLSYSLLFFLMYNNITESYVQGSEMPNSGDLKSGDFSLITPWYRTTPHRVVFKWLSKNLYST